MNKHLIIKLSVAVILIVVGCGLLVAGFVTAPPGEIHESVLVAFGEILTFAGAVFGMQYHYKAEYLKHIQNKKSSQSHDSEEF